MKRIYRTYEDTEVVMLAINVQCPYCSREWKEYDKDDCGTTYTLLCSEDNEGCGREFEMHFDAN